MTRCFFFIDCNNAGIEFTHATACGMSVSDIENRSHVPEIVSSFFPLNGLLNCEGISNPLLGVQVTELVDGYFIGCTANHSVVDGVSFWHFFNSWSEISRGSDSISKPPIFERWFPSNICNSNRLIPVPPLQPNLQNNFSSVPLQDRFFQFSRESIARLKAKANSEARTDKISSLQALSAHLWRAVIRARHSSRSPDSNQEISCMLVVGARSRIPLPDRYFGNALHRARLTTSELELLQQSLGWAALKLNELVAEQTREAAVGFVEEWVKNPNIVSKGINTFVVSSSPRFNVYGNDFGWGKPAAVRSGKAQKFDGMMTVFPGLECSGRGVDVEASLAPLTLLAMGADAEFMEFVTI
ncbi:UNVERIFIED_CONTAM: putative acetyltransferase [Sesamum latifolium]|uniref:Acetyltransferase n=1 Tax=Sesamum latifolium TaxID=2727402 RepID=A0AAW2UJ82_9LAMI